MVMLINYRVSKELARSLSIRNHQLYFRDILIPVITGPTFNCSLEIKHLKILLQKETKPGTGLFSPVCLTIKTGHYKILITGRALYQTDLDHMKIQSHNALKNKFGGRMILFEGGSLCAKRGTNYQFPFYHKNHHLL